MSILAVAAVLLLQDPDTGEQFYKFKAGTTWTFAIKDAAKDGKLRLKVEKEEGGKPKEPPKEGQPPPKDEPLKLFVESTEQHGDKPPRIEKMVWTVDKGMVVWLEVKDDKPPAPMVNL